MNLFVSLFRKKNLAGMTLVEVAVAGAVMSGAFLSTVAAMRYQAAAKQKAKQAGDTAALPTDIISGMKGMLFEVTDSQKQNTLGLCKLFKLATPNVRNSAGKTNVVLAEIRLDLSATKRAAAFDAATWNQWFPKWEPSTDGKCPTQTPFKKCWAPRMSSYPADQQENLKKLNVIAVTEIVPVALDPDPDPTATYDTFDALPDSITEIDVKRVGMLLTATISYGTTQPKTVQQSAFKWVGDVGFCTVNGLKLAPSGTLEGDSTGKVVYNTPSFEKGLVQPLEVIPEKKQIQVGKVENRRIQSDPSQNIEVSCTEKRFQCRNNTTRLRDYDYFMTLNYQLLYKSNNSILPRENTRIAPKVTIRKDSELADDSTSASVDVLSSKGAFVEFNLGQDEFYRWPNGHFYNAESPSLAPKSEMAVYSNRTHELTAFINNSENACREICSKDNYETLPYKPRLEYDLWDILNKDNAIYHSEHLSTNPIGCTACYMKNCQRLGLGTFGPMKTQPSEALDSSLPECAVNADDKVAQQVPLDATKTNLSPNQCVAASLDSTATAPTLIFTTRNCSEQLPVMCFNYGKFFLAQSISATQNTFSKTTFSNADNRCYETGREDLDIDQVFKWFDQHGTLERHRSLIDLLPKVSGRGNFVNNVAQGSFLAPQTSEQILAAAENIKSKGFSDGYFWVAYKTDEAANLMASPPVMPQDSNDIQFHFSLFFDRQGQARLHRHDLAPTALSDRPGTADPVGGYLLTNHLRYRGLVKAKTTQTSTANKFEFLCRKNSAPFVFKTTGKASGNQQDGISACQNEGGVFVPPTTPLGWVKAMLTVAPNDDNHPFPDPDVPGVKRLWVGLETDGTLVSGLAEFGTGTRSSFVNAKGGFVSSETAAKVMCIQNDGDFQAVSYQSSNERKGCPSDTEFVKADDLKGTVNQIRWLMATIGIGPTTVFYVGE